jgi:hypothetical protein
MFRVLLTIFVLVASGSAAIACPTVMQGRASYNVTGDFLYSPQSYGVTAGGDQSLRGCGWNHSGYVISQPDFSFYTSGMGAYGRLEIEVTSAACDTVLLVNSANGSWYYDDDSAGSLRPRINLYGTSNTQGRVDVWVGTFGSSLCSATLEMETWYN